MSLANDAKVEVDILTANVGFTEVRPRILRGERALIKDVAKAVQHGARWKAALVGGFGGMATRTVNVDHSGDFSGSYHDSSGYGSFGGSYRGQSTLHVPDSEARANAQAKARQMIQEAEARSTAVVSTALLDTTLRPGEAVHGFVYFKRDKAMKAGVLQIKVGTVSFEFPLEWQ